MGPGVLGLLQAPSWPPAPVLRAVPWAPSRAWCHLLGGFGACRGI